MAEKPMLELTRVKRGAWQNWLREGLMTPAHPTAFAENEVLEAVLVKALRSVHELAMCKRIWRVLRSEAERAQFIAAAQTLNAEERYDLVLEPRGAGLRLARNDPELVAAVRFPGAPRDVIILPLADELRRVRDDFRVLARMGAKPNPRTRRTSSRRDDPRPVRDLPSAS
jgi:hypothetical protein